MVYQTGPSIFTKRTLLPPFVYLPTTEALYVLGHRCAFDGYVLAAKRTCTDLVFGKQDLGLMFQRLSGPCIYLYIYMHCMDFGPWGYFAIFFPSGNRFHFAMDNNQGSSAIAGVTLPDGMMEFHLGEIGRSSHPPRWCVSEPW